MKRTGMGRSLAPVPSRRPMRQVSAKRRSTWARRRQVREEVLARDGGCVARTTVLSVACIGPVDVHEVLTRARGGDPLDPDNCVSLCRAHHDWTHREPLKATALGLLRSAT